MKSDRDAPARREPPRVLVVDDEPDVRELVADLLEPVGARLSEAATYEAARAQLGSGEIDLVVLDVMGVRGYDLLEEFGQQIPCIMLTGKALGLANVRRAFDGNAVLYLPKERLLDLPDCVERALANASAPVEAALADAEILAADSPVAPSRGVASLWRWFASRVDPVAWLGGAWFREDPALVEELEVVSKLRQVPLAEGLPEAELQILAELVEVEHFANGATICREGEDEDAGLYVIHAGAARVETTEKSTAAGERLGPGDAFGEGPLVLQRPPTATVRAVGDASVYRIRASRFHDRSAELSETVSRVIARLQASTPTQLVADTVDLLAHLRVMEAHQREAKKALAAASQERLATRTLVVLVAWATLYAFGLAAVRVSGNSKLILSRVLELLTLLTILYLTYGNGESLKSLGVRLGRWRKALWESLAFAVVFCALATLAKVALRPHFPALEATPLLMFSTERLGLYIGGAIAQEFISRGAVLTTLQRVLVGRWSTVQAIVVSSLLFGASHLHYGLALGVGTTILGCAWGWLFVRHRTLLGVTISHILIGVWVLEVLIGRSLLESVS